MKGAILVALGFGLLEVENKNKSDESTKESHD